MTPREWKDAQSETSAIVEVRECDGGYELTMENGWSYLLDKSYGMAPLVGDVLVTWGGIGYPVRGVAILRTLFYRTPAEQEVRNREVLDAAFGGMRKE